VGVVFNFLVIDYGSGTGSMTRALLEAYPEVAEVTQVERSSDLAHKVRSQERSQERG
jgi:phospholipid N-methyltransferase